MTASYITSMTSAASNDIKLSESDELIASFVFTQRGMHDFSGATSQGDTYKKKRLTEKKAEEERLGLMERDIKRFDVAIDNLQEATLNLEEMEGDVEELKYDVEAINETLDTISKQWQEMEQLKETIESLQRDRNTTRESVASCVNWLNVMLIFHIVLYFLLNFNREEPSRVPMRIAFDR